MLSQLSIENIALIDKLELTLSNGLNVLSGETGAGKSIIIDSLNFVLGERADKSLIRYGTDQAVVQAVFEDYLTQSVKEYLDDLGIDAEDVLILRRKMTVDGKNECRINGRISTLSEIINIIARITYFFNILARITINLDKESIRPVRFPCHLVPKLQSDV